MSVQARAIAVSLAAGRSRSVTPPRSRVRTKPTVIFRVRTEPLWPVKDMSWASPSLTSLALNKAEDKGSSEEPS